jgi:hypothetical protein
MIFWTLFDFFIFYFFNNEFDSLPVCLKFFLKIFVVSTFIPLTTNQSLLPKAYTLFCKYNYPQFWSYTPFSSSKGNSRSERENIHKKTE